MTLPGPRGIPLIHHIFFFFAAGFVIPLLLKGGDFAAEKEVEFRIESPTSRSKAVMCFVVHRG